MRAGRAQEHRESTEEARTAVEAGFTLVEVLVSLTILSIVMVAVVGGMNMLVLSSALNRSQGTVGSVLNRAAEAVRGGDGYVTCLSLTASSYDLGMPATANLLPENAIAPRVQLPSVVQITNFDGSKVFWTQATGVQVPNCAGNATAIQVVQIKSVSTNAEISQTVYVVKSP